jgi:hypothetical protein
MGGILRIYLISANMAVKRDIESALTGQLKHGPDTGCNPYFLP